MKNVITLKSVEGECYQLLNPCESYKHFYTKILKRNLVAYKSLDWINSDSIITEEILKSYVTNIDTSLSDEKILYEEDFLPNVEFIVRSSYILSKLNISKLKY